jgi:hypothetical protein
MPRKPKAQLSQPPRPLGKHGTALWRSITSEYDVSDASGREFLCLAAQALDRAEECAARIAADGPIVTTNSGAKEHPLTKAELQNRAFVARTLDRLGLTYEPVKAPGRPAGSWTFGR